MESSREQDRIMRKRWSPWSNLEIAIYLGDSKCQKKKMIMS